MTTHQPVKGALFVILGEFMFASVGVCIRQIADDIPNEMVVFFRNLFGLAVLMPWILHAGLHDLRTRVPHLHLLRDVMGLAAMYCFFYAIANIPLAQAMILKMSAPLFIPIIAWLWLSERLSLKVSLAIVIGFTGVVIVIQPGADPEMQLIALIALAGGVCAAVAKTSLRRLSRTEPVKRTVFYFALFGSLVSAIPLGWSWVTPDASAWLFLLLIGTLSTLGQLCLTRGMSLAAAGKMGTFAYFSVIFGALYGWFLFDEHITFIMAGGFFLIAFAGILVTRKENRQAIR